MYFCLQPLVPLEVVALLGMRNQVRVNKMELCLVTRPGKNPVEPVESSASDPELVSKTAAEVLVVDSMQIFP